MELKELIHPLEVLEVVGNTDVEISGIQSDSRTVEKGFLFVAVRGTTVDGHDYIQSAIGKGAAAIVCEEIPALSDEDIQVSESKPVFIRVKDSADALGKSLSAWYENPSDNLILVGVTGTNGKTTIATLLYEMFRKMGHKVGLLSTVCNYIDGEAIPTDHTTPDPVTLHNLMARMVEAGCEYAFMEVSSHSLVQHRIEGLSFVGAVFSNITHDHLDYHHTFAEYIRAKKMLFDALPEGTFALTNADDRNGMVMVQNTGAEVKTYALQAFADFRCRIVEMHFDGMLLNLDGSEVWATFLGRFNAYNLTAVYATALLLGADRDEVLRILSELTSVSGRFEYVRSADGVTAIVDYAHTPDALQNVLRTIDEIRREGQRIYVVVGCGGNRDKTKRPEMAQIAVANSDLAILTSDNPRMEDPETILEDMKAGLDPSASYLAVTNRREAIRTAVTLARPGDIILLAGKGHETYQDIAGVKRHFDDKEEVSNLFALRTKK